MYKLTVAIGRMFSVFQNDSRKLLTYGCLQCRCFIFTLTDCCFVDIGTIGPAEEIEVDNSLQGKYYPMIVFCL